MKITKNKNKYFSYLQKQFSKFAVVLVVVSMLFGTLGINQTSAYFTSSATVSGNTFTAGTLAFHLNPSTDFTSSALAKGGTASYSTTLANDGSLGFQYTVKATNLNTDVDLCNALTLQATNSAYTYNGSLSSFSAPARSYDTSAWNFVVTLPSGANDTLQDKTCNFKFTFNGWQEGLSSTEGFSDTEQISGSISSGHWVAPAVTINPGDVVINELMWMGSSGTSNDEWIELRNMTGGDINISNWKITNLTGDANTENLMITIPDNTIISANRFFLISRYSKESSNINVDPNLVDSGVVLRNDKLQIKLYKGDWTNSSNLIDTADDGSGAPAAGSNNTLKQSMERNINIVLGNNGTLAGSWHTCIDSGCNSVTYWKTAGSNNYGTPGGPNLSTNDPTSSEYVQPMTPAVDTATEDNSADTTESAPADTTTEQPATDTITDDTVTTDNTEATDATVTDDTTATTDDDTTTTATTDQSAQVLDTTTIQSPAETSTVDTSSVDTSANEIK